MNTFSKEDTILIIGDSPFLFEVKDIIQYLISKYTSIGINSILSNYKTTYHVFAHNGMYDYSKSNPEINIVCPNYISYRIDRNNVEYFDIFQFNFSKDTDVYKEGKLAWCGFTHDYAISYCVYKGWKNIVLIGVADFIEGIHYSRPNDKFVYSSKNKLESQKFIKYCNTKTSLYTCNPDSSLEIEKINIKTLLS